MVLNQTKINIEFGTISSGGGSSHSFTINWKTKSICLSYFKRHLFTNHSLVTSASAFFKICQFILIGIICVPLPEQAHTWLSNRSMAIQNLFTALSSTLVAWVTDIFHCIHKSIKSRWTSGDRTCP